MTLSTSFKCSPIPHPEERLAAGEGDPHPLPDRVQVFPGERANVGQEGFNALVHRRLRPAPQPIIPHREAGHISASPGPGCPAPGQRRPPVVSGVSRLVHKLRQLGDVGGDAPGSSRVSSLAAERRHGSSSK
jgi:hypothetical protein